MKVLLLLQLQIDIRRDKNTGLALVLPYILLWLLKRIGCDRGEIYIFQSVFSSEKNTPHFYDLGEHYAGIG